MTILQALLTLLTVLVGGSIMVFLFRTKKLSEHFAAALILLTFIAMVVIIALLILKEPTLFGPNSSINDKLF